MNHETIFVLHSSVVVRSLVVEATVGNNWYRGEEDLALISGDPRTTIE
jgi:hypothetical protein